MKNTKLDSQFINSEDLLFLIDKLKTQKGENRRRDVTGLYAGQMVWIKNGAGNWCYAKYVGRKLNQIGVIFGDNCGTLYYSEYSILNPHPDSIEARLITVLRELELDAQPFGRLHYLITDMLDEINSYK